ncbi:unnamed protein product [Sphenostylis stenocarpa]|uniref:Uncharacterized protein n=1 Tax=Sphenostylis stenocarpa TaxID=92480 RepID=A0AA86TCC5_9FABA|nr:unnamed protein product [Sphenostylis stenocarpa]
MQDPWKETETSEQPWHRATSGTLLKLRSRRVNTFNPSRYYHHPRLKKKKVPLSSSTPGAGDRSPMRRFTIRWTIKRHVSIQISV